MPHHYPARITRQAPRRFRGNVAGLVQHGLAGLRWVRQHRGVNVDHHLVPLARDAGIEPLVQGRLGEQGERVRVLLSPGRGRLDWVSSRPGRAVLAPPLVKRLAGRVERPQQERADFRR